MYEESGVYSYINVNTSHKCDGSALNTTCVPFCIFVFGNYGCFQSVCKYLTLCKMFIMETQHSI